LETDLRMGLVVAGMSNLPVGVNAIPPAELASVIKNVYSRIVKSSEFKRWLAKQGVAFGTQKGSHLKLFYNGRHSILPMHCKELGKGLVETIKKQLGLKEQE